MRKAVEGTISSLVKNFDSVVAQLKELNARSTEELSKQIGVSSPLIPDFLSTFGGKLIEQIHMDLISSHKMTLKGLCSNLEGMCGALSSPLG
jgi:hypothetical protein